MQVEELKDVVRRRAPRDPPVVLAGFSAGLGLSTTGRHACIQQTYGRSQGTEAHTARRCMVRAHSKTSDTDLKGGGEHT